MDHDRENEIVLVAVVLVVGRPSHPHGWFVDATSPQR